MIPDRKGNALTFFRSWVKKIERVSWHKRGRTKRRGGGIDGTVEGIGLRAMNQCSPFTSGVVYAESVSARENHRLERLDAS